MKTTLAAGLVVAFLSSAVFAQNATSVKDTKVVVKTSKGTPGTLAQLNKRIPEVSFQDLPFDQVVDWIADYRATVESSRRLAARHQKNTTSEN